MLKQENDDCRNQLMSTDRKKIDYWLVDRVFISHHDWLIDIENREIDSWLIDWLRTENRQLSRFVKILLVISFTKTSCFVISQQENFTLWRFYFKHSRISTSDEDFVSTRVSLLVTDDFLFIRVFLRAIWRSNFAYSRISTSNLFRRKFDRTIINLANSVREICCARDSESSSLRLIERFRAEDEIVTNCQRSCFFLLADRLQW